MKFDGLIPQSMSEMFSEPYLDLPFATLADSHGFEIERLCLNKFSHYTPRQLLQHYELEAELADKLKRASKKERQSLYASLYDKLFREIDFHPQFNEKASPGQRAVQVQRSLAIFGDLLSPDSVFLELGPGDCGVSFAVAERVQKVYAVDVSEVITEADNVPDNFQLVISDGTSVDVPPGSVDVAFSDQLMEHLHPDDALEQLRGIYTALRKGGVYVCSTPHKYGGPHDVSRFFDREAKGFHLKEYTNREMRTIFRAAGFNGVYTRRRIADRYYNFPVWLSVLAEIPLGPLRYSRNPLLYDFLRPLISLRFVGRK